MFRIFVSVLASVLLSTGPSWAQDEGGGEAAAGGDVFADADEAAKQSSNPLGGDFMVWLNQWNLDFLQGDITEDTRNAYTHIFQPVIPIPLEFIGPDWIWVNRPTLPIIYDAEIPTGPSFSQPGFSEFANKSGLGDIVYFSLLGISRDQESELFGDGALVLAGGLTTLWPTGRNLFSDNVWAMGPAGVASYIGDKYIFGVLAQHWSKYAKESNGPKEFNLTNAQVFYFKNFSGGWQIGGSPQIVVDWEADGGDKLSLPIGLGVFKTQIFGGKMPIKFGIEAQYFVARPDTFGTEWRIQFTIAPITPNFVAIAAGLGEMPGGKK